MQCCYSVFAVAVMAGADEVMVIVVDEHGPLWQSYECGVEGLREEANVVHSSVVALFRY